MSQILVDTDILIDVANNDAIAKARLVSESQTSTLAMASGGETIGQIRCIFEPHY